MNHKNISIPYNFTGESCSFSASYLLGTGISNFLTILKDGIIQVMHLDVITAEVRPKMTWNGLDSWLEQLYLKEICVRKIIAEQDSVG